MPAATDWDGTFLPSVLAHFNGGKMNINNPPYVLFPLIPFALLPVDAGRVLVLLVALAALALVVAPILARIELPVRHSRLAMAKIAMLDTHATIKDFPPGFSTRRISFREGGFDCA